MPKQSHILVLAPRTDVLERIYSTPIAVPAMLTLSSNLDEFRQLAQRFPFHGFVLDADFLAARTWDVFQEIKLKHPTAFFCFLTPNSAQDAIRAMTTGKAGWQLVYPPFPIADMQALFTKLHSNGIAVYHGPESDQAGPWAEVGGLLAAEQKIGSLSEAATFAKKNPRSLIVLHFSHPDTTLAAFIRDMTRAAPEIRLMVLCDHPAEEAVRYAIRNNGWTALSTGQGVSFLLDQLHDTSARPAAGKAPAERILVADDEPNILDFIVDILSDQGYSVDGYPSGATAFEAMKKKEYQVALVDFQLGDTTGLALAREFRQIDPDLNVILMTAHASLDMAVKAIQADVYDYLIKPVDTNHLKRSIFKALEKRRLALEIKALVADLQRANHQLNRLNELKSRFLSIVTHDLRTPLTSIKGYAQVLNLQKDMAPEQRENFLGTIAKEADHLGALINDLMDFVSIEAGKLRVEKAPGSVTEVLDDIRLRMTSLAEKKQIRFQIAAQPNLPEIVLDKRRIDQVLTNLIGNAFKHTPPEGSVTVAAENKEGAIHLSVTDTGEGIPPNDLPRIFEQFYQVEAHASKREGIGLGLNIAKEIVQAHGGDIGVRSEGAGHGSCFWFTLPVTSVAPGTETPKPAEKV